MLKKRYKYTYGKTFLKVYGDKKIKLSRIAVCRVAGYEDDEHKTVKKCSVNGEKLLNNISRAKSRVYELSICNDWQWFFTGTLDKEKYDRQNLNKFHKDLTRFIRNYNALNNIKITFVLVPELHKDGKSWHIHGLLNGLPVEHLTQFKVGDKMGKYIADKVKKGELVYNWDKYAKKFGFCDLEPIKSHEGVCGYLTKYISKDLCKCVTELNAHSYYCSRGLKRAEKIKDGFMSWEDIRPSYSNDYCIVSMESYNAERLQELSSKIY